MAAPHHAPTIAHEAGKHGAVLGGITGKYIEQKACDGVGAASAYLISQTDLPKGILGLIFPGYVARYYANYQRGLAVASSFLVNNLGVSMSREIRSRSVSTQSGPTFGTGDFFGPNFRADEAIKVAQGMEELLDISIGSSATTDGEESDIAERIERAGSGCYYLTH